MSDESFSMFVCTPSPNEIVGCGCMDAATRFLERLDVTTGKWTRTAMCCTCGDAKVVRGTVEVTPAMLDQIHESLDHDSDDDEMAGEEWKR